MDCIWTTMPLRCQEMMERKVPPPSCSMEPSRACRRKHAPDRSHAGVARRDCTPGFHTGLGPKPSDENPEHMRGRESTKLHCVRAGAVTDQEPTALHWIGFGQRAQSSVRIRPVHSVALSRHVRWWLGDYFALFSVTPMLGVPGLATPLC